VVVMKEKKKWGQRPVCQLENGKEGEKKGLAG
jgi:hypothetical protein